MKSNSFIKTTAIFLSFCLSLSESLSYAGAILQSAHETSASLSQKSASVSSHAAADQLSIPSDLGTLEEIYQSPNSKRTIIYIQDAHDSLEAQQNIAKLIHYLVEHQGIETVFEEGYEGPVPSDDYFGFIQDPITKERVSYFLLDKLRLGGAEYAHINRTKDFKLMGADSLSLHLQNIEWYRKSAQKKEEIEKDLDQFERQLKKLANQFFPKPVKEWMRLRKRLDQNELNLIDYLTRLWSLRVKNHAKIARLVDFPNIQHLLALQHQGNPRATHSLEKIDTKLLFKEIELLENDFAKASLQTPRDQKIFSFYKNIQLLNRLINIQITSDEYEALKDTLKNLKTQDLASFFVEETKRSQALPQTWEENIQHAIKFYELAEARDQVIQKTLLESTENNAVLVFGGFHKSNIKRMLRENGFSYYILSPNMTDLDSKHQDYYKQLMSTGYHSFEVPFYVSKAAKTPGTFNQPAAVAASEVRSIYDGIRSLAPEAFQRGDWPRQVERLLTAQKPSTNNIRSETRSTPQQKRDALRKIFGEKDIRYLALDYDDTFALSKMYPSRRAFRVVNRLAEKGIAIDFVSSARDDYLEARLLKEYGLNRRYGARFQVVAEQGGVVYRWNQRRKNYDRVVLASIDESQKDAIQKIIEGVADEHQLAKEFDLPSNIRRNKTAGFAVKITTEELHVKYQKILPEIDKKLQQLWLEGKLPSRPFISLSGVALDVTFNRKDHWIQYRIGELGLSSQNVLVAGDAAFPGGGDEPMFRIPGVLGLYSGPNRDDLPNSEEGILFYDTEIASPEGLVRSLELLDEILSSRSETRSSGASDDQAEYRRRAQDAIEYLQRAELNSSATDSEKAIFAKIKDFFSMKDFELRLNPREKASFTTSDSGQRVLTFAPEKVAELVQGAQYLLKLGFRSIEENRSRQWSEIEGAFNSLNQKIVWEEVASFVLRHERLEPADVARLSAEGARIAASEGVAESARSAAFPDSLILAGILRESYPQNVKTAWRGYEGDLNRFLRASDVNGLVTLLGKVLHAYFFLLKERQVSEIPQRLEEHLRATLVHYFNAESGQKGSASLRPIILEAVEILHYSDLPDDLKDALEKGEFFEAFPKKFGNAVISVDAYERQYAEEKEALETLGTSATFRIGEVSKRAAESAGLLGSSSGVRTGVAGLLGQGATTSREEIKTVEIPVDYEFLNFSAYRFGSTIADLVSVLSPQNIGDDRTSLVGLIPESIFQNLDTAYVRQAQGASPLDEVDQILKHFHNLVIMSRNADQAAAKLGIDVAPVIFILGQIFYAYGQRVFPEQIPSGATSPPQTYRKAIQKLAQEHEIFQAIERYIQAIEETTAEEGNRQVERLATQQAEGEAAQREKRREAIAATIKADIKAHRPGLNVVIPNRLLEKAGFEISLDSFFDRLREYNIGESQSVLNWNTKEARVELLYLVAGIIVLNANHVLTKTGNIVEMKTEDQNDAYESAITKLLGELHPDRIKQSRPALGVPFDEGKKNIPADFFRTFLTDYQYFARRSQGWQPRVLANRLKETQLFISQFLDAEKKHAAEVEPEEPAPAVVSTGRRDATGLNRKIADLERQLRELREVLYEVLQLLSQPDVPFADKARALVQRFLPPAATTQPPKARSPRETIQEITDLLNKNKTTAQALLLLVQQIEKLQQDVTRREAFEVLITSVSEKQQALEENLGIVKRFNELAENRNELSSQLKTQSEIPAETVESVEQLHTQVQAFVTGPLQRAEGILTQFIGMIESYVGPSSSRSETRAERAGIEETKKMILAKQLYEFYDAPGRAEAQQQRWNEVKAELQKKISVARKQFSERKEVWASLEEDLKNARWARYGGIVHTVEHVTQQRGQDDYLLSFRDETSSQAGDGTKVPTLFFAKEILEGEPLEFAVEFVFREVAKQHLDLEELEKLDKELFPENYLLGMTTLNQRIKKFISRRVTPHGLEEVLKILFNMGMTLIAIAEGARGRLEPSEEKHIVRSLELAVNNTASNSRYLRDTFLATFKEISKGRSFSSGDVFLALWNTGITEAFLRDQLLNMRIALSVPDFAELSKLAAQWYILWRFIPSSINDISQTWLYEELLTYDADIDDFAQFLDDTLSHVLSDFNSAIAEIRNLDAITIQEQLENRQSLEDLEPLVRAREAMEFLQVEALPDKTRIAKLKEYPAKIRAQHNAMVASYQEELAKLQERLGLLKEPSRNVNIFEIETDAGVSEESAAPDSSIPSTPSAVKRSETRIETAKSFNDLSPEELFLMLAPQEAFLVDEDKKELLRSGQVIIFKTLNAAASVSLSESDSVKYFFEIETTDKEISFILLDVGRRVLFSGSVFLMSDFLLIGAGARAEKQNLSFGSWVQNNASRLAERLGLSQVQFQISRYSKDQQKFNRPPFVSYGRGNYAYILSENSRVDDSPSSVVETRSELRQIIAKLSDLPKIERVAKSPKAIFEPKPIRDLREPVGVFLDVSELKQLKPNQVSKRFNELLTLLDNHPAFDLYLDGTDYLELHAIENPQLKKLLREYPDQIHVGPRDQAQLTKKEILIRVFLTHKQTTLEETSAILQDLKTKYRFQNEIHALDYTKPGALKGFLDLAESFKAGELIREVSEAYAVMGPHGRWRLAESYLTSVWAALRASFAIQWSA